MKINRFPIMKKTGLLQAAYGLASMLFSLLTAYSLSGITEKIQASAVDEGIEQCLWLLLLLIFYGISLTLFHRLLLSTRIREQLQVREGILRNILHDRCGQSDQASAGRILENLGNDCDRVMEHYGTRRPLAAVRLLAVTVYLTISLQLSWEAAFFMLCMAFLQLIPHVMVKRIFMKNYLDCRDIEAEITDIFIAGYQGAAEIKVYGALSWLNQMLREKHLEYEKIGMRSEIAFTGETMISSLASQLLKYGYFAILGLLFSMGIIQASGVAAMAVVSAAFFSGMDALFQIIPQFSVDRAAVGRLARWLTPQSDRTGSARFCAGEGEGQWLHVKGLKKFYEDRGIFQNFTVDIPLDRRVVICGENGSGKTTFLRIAAGETQGKHGTVWSDCGYWEALIEGGGISFLPQECPGLNFSILDLLGTEQEGFYRLAGQFGLDEDLVDRPINSLSGGQKKKIYLAAAFARKAPLLILDEPDNDLDETGKAVLREQMMTYPGGILYVSHEREMQELAQFRINMNDVGAPE